MAPPNGSRRGHPAQTAVFLVRQDMIVELAPEVTRRLAVGEPVAEEDPEAHPTVQALRTRLGDGVEKVARDTTGYPVVYVEPARNQEALGFLRDEPSQSYEMLVDVMGMDPGEGRPIQVWYQLWSLRHGRQLRLTCELSLDDMTLQSVTSLWKSADWLEREVYDMFGVVFRGHPDLRRILMPENYEEGFPLRKDFPLRGRFSRSEQVRRCLSRSLEDVYSKEELALAGYEDQAGASVLGMQELAGDQLPEDVLREASGSASVAKRKGQGEAGDQLEATPMLINMGPQHPATHGVLRLVLELDGESVRRCIPHIGYLHTGFEKTCEYREWNQIIPYTDRMDYLSPMLYNIGYACAVERLLGLEITPRCRVLRVILSEMNRMLAHLLWLGTTAIDLGAFSVFLYTFQERERIYNLHEAYCGARLTTSVTRIGGMLADLPPGWVDGVREFANTVSRTLDECERLLTRNAIWVSRTQEIGVMSADEAVSYGLTGPNLRASGVPYDVRKARPYLGYEEYDFEIPVGERGDTYDRYLVRIEEMRQSVRIIQQGLDTLPDGPINVEDRSVILPPKSAMMDSIDAMIAHFKLVMEGLSVPAGDTWFSVEGAKGELAFGLVSDGGTKPVRCRFRCPSFLNMSALPHLVEGELVADVIAINASLDVVLGEIDR